MIDTDPRTNPIAADLEEWLWPEKIEQRREAARLRSEARQRASAKRIEAIKKVAAHLGPIRQAIMTGNDEDKAAALRELRTGRDDHGWAVLCRVECVLNGCDHVEVGEVLELMRPLEAGLKYFVPLEREPSRYPVELSPRCGFLRILPALNESELHIAQ